MKKLLLPLMAIIAASCSPFPQDGTAKTVYVSVSLTYEDSQKAIPLPYTDNDARAFRDENAVKDYIIVCRELFERTTEDGIRIMPWKVFLDKLWNNEIVRIAE